MNSTTTDQTEPYPNRPRVRLALGIVAVALYSPFSWLLVTETDWHEYQRSWIKLWPILPGLMPGALLFHPHEVAEFITMGMTTFVLLVSLTWLGSRGWRRLLAAAVIALLISIPSSMVAHSFYWF